VLLWIGEVGAGELMLANGSRLHGELTNEMLVVSTGSDLIEVAPEQVSVIMRGELQLRDGRTVRGTLVGGHLRVRTSLGEIAVMPDELRAYRAHGEAWAPDAASPPASTAVVAKPGKGAPGEAQASQSLSAAATPPLASVSPQGLPSVALYQPGTRSPDAAPAPGTRTPAAMVAATPPAVLPTSAVDGRTLGRGVQLEVIADEAPLRRDAIAAADPVGRVSRGQRVTYVDTIDRRLRMFNVLLFDGGHWVRVRAADGSEGWLPAGTVRKTR
jgi:hypothetical protein